MGDGLAYLPWFPGDFLAATVGWPLVARAVYRELLDAQWTLGRLPVDLAELRDIARATPAEFASAWKRCEAKFPDLGGYRLNQRLEEHRGKSLNLKAARSKGAQIANARRWAGHVTQRSVSDRSAIPDAGQSAIAQRSLSVSPPTPTPTLTLTEDPKSKSAPRRSPRTRIRDDQEPGPEDVAYCEQHLVDANVAAIWRQFRDHHVAKGSEFASWSAAWRTWVRNITERGYSYVRRAEVTAPPAGPRFASIPELKAWDAAGRPDVWPPLAGPWSRSGMAGEPPRADGEHRGEPEAPGNPLERRPAAPF